MLNPPLPVGTRSRPFSIFEPIMLHGAHLAGRGRSVNENLVRFFRHRPEVFPLQRDIDLERFLAEVIDQPFATLPIPAKIFLSDEIQPQGYGFPVMKTTALDDLESRLSRWLDDEIAARSGGSTQKGRADESLQAYRVAAVKLARNALHSSILADYHSIFWLIHSGQVAHAMTALTRRVAEKAPAVSHDQADTIKHAVAARWMQAIRDSISDIDPDGDDRKFRFLRMILDNPLIVTEEFIGQDLRELRSYFTGSLRRDFAICRKWIDGVRARVTELMSTDRLFNRSMTLLGYPDKTPAHIALLDRRVHQLLDAHPSYKTDADQPLFDQISKRLLEFALVYHLRRGLVWMKTTADGENVSDGTAETTIYSRAIRPMNFGRRGIVEPIVFRFGLVYDITSFTQTLGEVARAGQEEEQASYRQMLEFQRDLADVSKRHGLQFEKFLGDGAFYTSRRATRILHAAIEVQTFYAAARAKGFAFNKGMRIALNYGYYRLLPMQVTSDGNEIKEFYGPGIVELSRLTTGKATKELEDIQHLLLSHGYDQMEVYKFFAPLSRAERGDNKEQQREFYAYVNESGHLINEGIVVSVPFLKQLSTEIVEDGQRLYRLRSSWSSYLGIPATNESGTYIGFRMLGSVSLKGIGNQDVAEVVRLDSKDAEISMIDENKPFVQLLQQERHRSTAGNLDNVDSEAGVSDLVVCQSNTTTPVLLVGEWDPVSEEVRRPVQLAGEDAERYGLEIPLTETSVETQSVAFQKLYRRLSRLDTLPNFSVAAIRDNANFSGFIIGATVERL
jgi:hypothetical protein